MKHTVCWVGQNNRVNTATYYWLDSPGIEIHWGRDLLYQPRSALGPTQPPVQRVWGLFPGSEVTRAITLSLYGHSLPVLE
jgi:hypothetical protein